MMKMPSPSRGGKGGDGILKEKPTLTLILSLRERKSV
jgi:hypothetical protein